METTLNQSIEWLADDLAEGRMAGDGWFAGTAKKKEEGEGVGELECFPWLRHGLR